MDSQYVQILIERHLAKVAYDTQRYKEKAEDIKAHQRAYWNANKAKITARRRELAEQKAVKSC